MKRRDERIGTVAEALREYPLVLAMLALGGLAAGALMGAKLARALGPARQST